MKRLLTATTAVAASALLLAGCGGGGSVSMMDPPAQVDLSNVTAGYTSLTAGTITIAAGEMQDHGDVTFTCAASGDDCVVTVAADGTVTSTGGMVSAEDSTAYTLRQTEEALRQAQQDLADARQALADAQAQSAADLAAAQAALAAAQAAAAQALADAQAAHQQALADAQAAADKALADAQAAAAADLAAAQAALAAAQAALDAAPTQEDLDMAQAALRQAQQDLADAQAQAQQNLSDAQAAAAQALADAQAAAAQALADAQAAAAANLANAQAALADAQAAAAAAETLARLFETAQDTTAAASAAAAAAAADANLTAVSVDGESETARANAQNILDALASANATLTAAKAALAEAKTLPDSAQSRAIIAALEEAIPNLEDNRDTLKQDRVDLVTGGDDADPQGTADTIARRVAAAVATAVDGVATGTAVPETVTLMNDSQGKTWAQIVGESNLIDTRIVATGGGTTAVKAMSVAGMSLTSTQTVEEVDDGTQVTTGIEYKGIVGTVFCNGADCAVEAVEDDPDTTGVDESTTLRKLVGSWYFTPTNADAIYANERDANGNYVVDNLYAQYGHWLADDGTFHTHASAATGAPASTAASWEDDSSLEGTATYEGSAAGMSVVRDSSDDAIKSGAFTADVSLTATFGVYDAADDEVNERWLSGTIDNFVGNAVGSGWSVTLNRARTEIGSVTDGVTNAGSRLPGTWSATSYGPATGRPVGIFGHFNANFPDGDAAGAYATRKTE